MLNAFMILMVAALILFAIPAIRALFRDGKVDFTNSGLACMALAFAISAGMF